MLFELPTGHFSQISVRQQLDLLLEYGCGPGVCSQVAEVGGVRAQLDCFLKLVYAALEEILELFTEFSLHFHQVFLAYAQKLSEA